MPAQDAALIQPREQMCGRLEMTAWVTLDPFKSSFHLANNFPRPTHDEAIKVKGEFIPTEKSQANGF